MIGIFLFLLFSTSPAEPCTISVPDTINVSPTIAKREGEVSVNLSGLTQTVPLTVVNPSAQISLDPLSYTGVGTSTIIAFRIRIKKIEKSSQKVSFQSACGNKDVLINVNIP